MFRLRSLAAIACAMLAVSPCFAALVGHWGFDSSATLGLDSAGENNNGVQQGSDTRFSSAARVGGGSLAIDGTGTGLRVGNPGDFQNLTSFTIAAFVKPDLDNPRFDNGGGVVGRVFGTLGIDGAGGTQFGANTGYGFGVRRDGGLRFTTYGVRDFDLTGPSLAEPLQANEWAHVAVTVAEPGLANFYINGALVGTIDDTRNPAATTNPFHIGASAIGDTDPFAGLIDDVRVYDEVLDATTIAGLANPGGAARQGLLLSINRDSGAIALQNDSDSSFTVTGYSVRSNAGALNPDAWQPLANSDDNWIVLSESPFDLSEGTVGTAVISPNQMIPAGNGVWSKTPFEDVRAEFLLEDGSITAGTVEYVGNNGAPFALGDFNFDNNIDLGDFAVLNANLFSDVSTLSPGESYAAGDLNSDGLVDEFDFILFKDTYTSAGGSLAALENFAAGVPEPATLALLVVPGMFVALRRRRAIAMHAGIMACAVVVLSSPATHAQLTPIFEYRFPASYDGSSTAVNDLSPANNDGTANVQSAGIPPFELNENIPAGEPATNRALDYSTTFGQITTNTNTLLNNPAVEAAGGFTYDLWFNPQDAGADMNGRRKILDYAGTEWISYMSNGPGGLPTLRVSIGNGQTFTDFQTGFDTNGWNRIRYVFNSAGNTIDQAGNLVGTIHVVLNDAVLSLGTGTKTGFGDTLDRPISIGRHPTGNSEHYRGLLYNPSVYLGALPFEDSLTLQVNTTTGAVSLAHEADEYYPDARNIDFYKITSADGSIVLANWSSLDDQNFGGGTNPTGDYNDNGTVDAADYAAWRNATGTAAVLPNDPTPGVDQSDFDTWRANFGTSSGSAGAWTEVGNPTSNAIGESFLTGSTMFDDGLSQSLGNLFEVGGEQDWVFTYHVVGEAGFQTGRVVYSGAGVASQAVPEPASLALLALGALPLAMARRRLRTLVLPLALLVFTATSYTIANAAVTLDRQYSLGEGAGEGGVAGSVVGSGNSFGLAFDSVGEASAGNLQDLTPFGAPTYANVSTRPLAGTGTQLGAQLDGTDDYLLAARLGLPATTQSSTAGTPPGPEDYSGITHRGYQFWTNPLDTRLGTAQQSLVVDTNQHGVLISNTGTWIMKYENINVNSGVPVATGEGADGWSHVMMVQPHGPFGGGSFLYVNGIAVAAASTGYVGTDNAPLVIGSNTAIDATGNFTGGTTDYFAGIVDNLQMFVLGTSIDTNTDYGTFKFGTDNQFAANALSDTVAGDLTGDGQVTGDGTGTAATDDVAALIASWGVENRVNGILVGDLSTRALGDFNFDGAVGLADWDILRGAHAGGANLNLAALLSGQHVPEPSTIGLLAIAATLVASVRRTRS